MQIKEIQTREEIAETYLVLRQIYENLNQETYVEDVLNQMQRGYKMRVIEVEDFMIDRAKRGLGVGKMLIRFLEWQATTFGCKNIIGSLETKRQESQKIFSREKFLLDGLFFKKP